MLNGCVSAVWRLSVQVGDLVREKTRMDRKPEMGIVLAVDFTQQNGLVRHLKVHFFEDGASDWMREGFLELLSESR